jgi:hypothetical protein
MDRNKALLWMSRGERAVQMYSGASKAWEGMQTGKTASNLMAEGIGAIIGAEDPLGANFKRAQEGREKLGAKGIMAILTGCMGAILLPALLPKKGYRK